MHILDGYVCSMSDSVDSDAGLSPVSLAVAICKFEPPNGLGDHHLLRSTNVRSFAMPGRDAHILHSRRCSSSAEARNRAKCCAGKSKKSAQPFSRVSERSRVRETLHSPIFLTRCQRNKRSCNQGVFLELKSAVKAPGHIR